MRSLGSLLNDGNNDFRLFPKGAFDYIFSLVNSFIHITTFYGCMPKNSTSPIEQLVINDSKAGGIFVVFFKCVLAGYDMSCIDFHIDFELAKALCSKEDISDKDLAEAILMAKILKLIKDPTEKTLNEFYSLSVHFCSPEVYCVIEENLKRVQKSLFNI